MYSPVSPLPFPNVSFLVNLEAPPLHLDPLQPDASWGPFSRGGLASPWLASVDFIASMSSWHGSLATLPHYVKSLHPQLQEVSAPWPRPACVCKVKLAISFSVGRFCIMPEINMRRATPPSVCLVQKRPIPETDRVRGWKIVCVCVFVCTYGLGVVKVTLPISRGRGKVFCVSECVYTHSLLFFFLALDLLDSFFLSSLCLFGDWQ